MAEGKIPDPSGPNGTPDAICPRREWIAAAVSGNQDTFGRWSLRSLRASPTTDPEQNNIQQPIAYRGSCSLAARQFVNHSFTNRDCSELPSRTKPEPPR